MNIVTVGVGCIMLVYGLYILLTRAQLPANQVRLQFFIRSLGKPVGYTAFSLVYVILPIGFGLFVLDQGLSGVSMSILLGPQEQ